MTHDELSDVLRTSLAQILNIDPSVITDDSLFIELDADSIDLIEVVGQVEAMMGIEISEQRFYDLEHFGRLVELVESEIAAAGGRGPETV